jgi:hypothetical protein
MRTSRKAYVRGHFHFSPHWGRGYSKILRRGHAGAAWQTCPMRSLIAVAFVEPVTEGLEFPREGWPLHITLVKFDVVGPKSLPETTPRPAADDSLAARIASLMEPPVAEALGSSVTVGSDAGFGRAGSVPVSLIDPSPALQGLHDALVRIVAEVPGRIATAGHTLEGYRPHVSHLGARRLHAGDVVVLDQIALVDMAPDGGHATRRVLKLWTG